MVREIKQSELKGLLELYGHMHENDDPLPETSVIESTWQEITTDSKITYFVLVKEEIMISACHITIIPNLTRGARPYGLIENVVTHKEFRRRGHGKALLKKVLEFAWSKNCYKVMLLTGRKDEGVYRFYESIGFDRHNKQAFIAKP